MLPLHIALVPFDDGDAARPPLDELMHVAAALQTQVVRDFGPIWNVSAVVSPFASLADVPADYTPVAIVTHKLPRDRRAFHFTIGGSPFALVQYVEAWSLAASHEVLEILCDPTGQTTAVAPSIADQRQKALTATGDSSAVVYGVRDYSTQGQVDYLLEICDPCETSTYQINDILVSDFVTPAYYDASTFPGARYSFTDRIPAPLTLVEGGYISWRSRLLASPSAAIFQADAPPTSTQDVINNALAGSTQPIAAPENLRIARLPELPSRLSREWLDAMTTPFPFPITPVIASYQPPKASQDWAATFRQDIQQLITTLALGVRQPSLDSLIRFVEYMSKPVNNERFKGMTPQQQKAKLRRSHLYGVTVPKRIRSPESYGRLLKRLEHQKSTAGLFGPDMLDPDMALWLCMLTNY